MSLSKEELWNIIETQNKDDLTKYKGLSGIATLLDTDLENGIKSSSAVSRVKKYGSNELPERPIRSFWEMLKDALSDQTVIILIICAVASLILECIFAPPEERSTAWIDGTAILVAVAVVSFVQASSNQKQEQQFAAVNRIKSIFDVAVIRDGQLRQLKNYELVVGDIVSIQQGDSIPADGLVITSENLKIDQSTANGENEAVYKDANDPFLISNTHVVEGCGTFLVLCVGLNSHHGRIFALINAEPEPTPLQIKLEALAEKIGLVGMFFASITFISLVIPWTIKQFKSGFTWAACREPLGYFVNALTIVACAVPEGLPLAVTISLAYSMRQMMKDNNFVRKLNACETMGSATVICADKTGTLTQNKMNVERIALGSEFKSLSESGILHKDEKFLNLLRKTLAVNTQAVLTDTGTIGSQTECALIRFCEYLHGNYHQLRIAHPPSIRFLFDRDRKRMSTIIPLDNKYRVMVKGAPDELIKLCTNYINENTEILPITEEFVKQYQEALNHEGDLTFRTLGLAYKDVSVCPQTVEEAESDLTLMCTTSIRDSLRESTAECIDQCQRAGIRVIMITGDHQNTAEAVGRECGIMKPGYRAVTGSYVRHLSNVELQEELKTIAIVARSSPMDKHLIVTALKEAGEIVSVTGDGTNDVPAMVAADVGLAMGKSGTELAKEASDIVVLDDDFKSIVRSVVWGRCVYNNIKRFLQFQLTANVVTLFVTFLSAVILQDTPFQAVQLLWVNLIMDSLGALALATGKPDDSLLKQMPEHKDAPLITNFMLKNIVGQALLQISLMILVLLMPGDAVKYSTKHYTYLFNVFVLCQMFNLINARVVSHEMKVSDGFLDNPLFFMILFGILIVQIILVQIAGLYFSCTPLSFHEWVTSTLLASLTIPVGFILRAFPFENIFDSCQPNQNDFERL